VTDDQLHYVREACGEAIRLNLVLPAIAEELRNIDGVIRDGNYLALKNRPVALGAIQKLYSVSKNIAPYKDAIGAIALELGIALDEGAPPPVVQPPVVVNTSETFSEFEIQKLGDLNFSARAAVNHTGPIKDRLMVLALALKAGTWKSWADVDRSYIVSLMGSTQDGHDEIARPILIRFALALGVVLTDVAFPSGQVVTQPPVVTNPPPPPAPVTEVPVVHVPAEFAAQVLAVFRAFDIHVRQGKLGVGIEPDADNPAALHIGGRSIASINGVSNIAGSDTQNPGERHSNIFCVCDNDGGMRGIQYGHWFNGQVIRNTTNRRMSIFALFDSMGDTCINDDVGGHGQDFYIVRDTQNKKVILAGYKPGWTIEVRETSPGAPYSAMDEKKL
jgi:hypothetical protein